VKVLASPVKSQLENFVELSDAGVAGHQQSALDQRTDVAEYNSELVKFSHLSRLPNLALKFSQPLPPGISCSPNPHLDAALGLSHTVDEQLA
jgi:hypothetical protein